MILADKIIYLRKKAGLSQEELADKMSVSRQAVSKWESAQSVPDIGKILQLSRIFDVSTDYLLKDEIEEEKGKRCEENPAPAAEKNMRESREFMKAPGASEAPGALKAPEIRKSLEAFVRRVSMEEASRFLEVKEETSGKIAKAVFLCILSPICLIALGGLSEYGKTALISENFACAAGMIVLVALATVAVAMFISAGGKREHTIISVKSPLSPKTVSEKWCKNTSGNLNRVIHRGI